jgi:putative transposase
MLVTLQKICVVPSFSRPSESLLRTLKYILAYPSRSFESLDAARKWVNEFVHRYNICILAYRRTVSCIYYAVLINIRN